MTGILIHIDDVTERRLQQIARELRREVRELAESAVAEAALEFFRGRPTSEDPAHQPARSNLQ